MNSLKCPKSKSLSHCITELFTIYQNKHWTIIWHDDRFIDPSSHRIILKIVDFLGSTVLGLERYTSFLSFHESVCNIFVVLLAIIQIRTTTYYLFLTAHIHMRPRPLISFFSKLPALESLALFSFFCNRRATMLGKVILYKSCWKFFL